MSRRGIRSLGCVSVRRSGDVDVGGILFGKIQGAVAPQRPHGTSDPGLSGQHDSVFGRKIVEFSIDQLPSGLPCAQPVQEVFLAVDLKPPLMPVSLYCEIVLGIADGFPAPGKPYAVFCLIAPADGILVPAGGRRGSVLYSSCYDPFERLFTRMDFFLICLSALTVMVLYCTL